MAFVKMPKDLSKVKNRVALNMTKRQLVSLGLAGLVGIPTFFVVNRVFGGSIQIAGFSTFISVAPFLGAAFYEKNGKPFEKIFKDMVSVFFIRPKKRPYKTTNFYDLLMRQSDLESEIRRIKREEN